MSFELTFLNTPWNSGWVLGIIMNRGENLIVFASQQFFSLQPWCVINYFLPWLSSFDNFWKNFRLWIWFGWGVNLTESYLSVRYTMSCNSPEPPGDLKLNMSRSEMMEYCQTPAKKFFNNIQVGGRATVRLELSIPGFTSLAALTL